ncbi:MAG: autotransporter assembly complex family protein [Pigmentiphaga sp.]
MNKGRQWIAACWLAVLGSGAAAAADRAPPEVTIDPGGVPPAVLQAVSRSVNHIAALSQDQDGGEIDRLRRRARDVTLTALATEGYFMPEVTLEANTDELGETWDITIRPGERAVIRRLELLFEGAITGPEFEARRRGLRERWGLPVGQPFRNGAWETSKRELLTSVADVDFALARMRTSQASVDPEAATVDLEVVIASGPKVLLGELELDGFEDVPSSLVSRYVRYSPGTTPYDRRQLIRWQQELQRTVFFSGVEIELDTRSVIRSMSDDNVAVEPTGDAVTAAATASAAVAVAATGEASAPQGGRFARFMASEVAVVPLSVTVIEAPRHRLDIALGLDSDVGPRAELMYRQNVVAGRSLELQTGIGLNRYRQMAFADIHLPPNPRGYLDKFGTLIEHQDIQGQDVQRVAGGWVRSQTRHGAGDSRVEYETTLGLIGSYERVRYADVRYSLPSVVASYEWLRRDVNNKYDPREGNLIALGAGLGSALNGFHPFSRLKARGQMWWPVGERDVFTIRGEVGKVWANDNTRTPADFGFRTGGARTIRGYRYLSLGEEVNGAVIGANALAVASVEYDHYFTEMWGFGVFVDAGDAASTFRDMDIAVGVGAGLRIRTPAGPIFVDLAYALRDKRLRLNFSLGIAF